jgi:hypothetical protein
MPISALLYEPLIILIYETEINYMRMAKIVVDSTQLENYKLALKEQMKTALKLEKGVLAYSAVQDKNNPAHITILKLMQALRHTKNIHKRHILKSIKLRWRI